MNPPSLADVLAACREPRWFTAAEVAAALESGRAHNAHVTRPEPAPKAVVKKQHNVSLLSRLPS